MKSYWKFYLSKSIIHKSVFVRPTPGQICEQLEFFNMCQSLPVFDVNVFHFKLISWQVLQPKWAIVFKPRNSSGSAFSFLILIVRLQQYDLVVLKQFYISSVSFIQLLIFFECSSYFEQFLCNVCLFFYVSWLIVFVEAVFCFF